MKKIDKRTKAYKRQQAKLKVRMAQSNLEDGVLKIPPYKEPYFASPPPIYAAPPEPIEPKKSQPFSVNFNTTADGSISFNFLFHGFKE